MRTPWRRRQSGIADDIVVVSGLPRSGTSLMMKMLEAGGVAAVTDGLRTADIDNPNGYYELERAKKLSSGDVSWLDDAEGKAVKVIATLLYDLPDTYSYRVVFMRRKMQEVLASQKTMLVNRGEDPDAIPDEAMARLYTDHLDRLESWIQDRPHISLLDVDYNDLVTGDGIEYAASINEFLGGGLDVEAMASVIAPDLYRQRVERPSSR